MTEEKKATAAGDVVLPIEYVELTAGALRSKDGARLVVRCEYVDEEVILQTMERGPGHTPILGVSEESVSIETARALVRYAPTILEAGCSLAGPDGSEIRPAFFFGDDPKNGSIPAKYLSMADRLRLLMTILRLSGYVGGAADSVRFPDRKREGSDARAGDLDSRLGDGDATDGSRTRSGESGEAPPA